MQLVDNAKGFERLVLPQAHKDIIVSQVKEHFRKKRAHTSNAQDDLDLVRGKGQGLIMLLHGASLQSIHEVGLHHTNDLKEHRVSAKPVLRKQLRILFRSLYIQSRVEILVALPGKLSRTLSSTLR